MALVFGVLLAGCTTPNDGSLTQNQNATAASTKQITGRLGLQFIDGSQPSVQLGFSLMGDSTEGQLVLETPFGTTLASAKWNPQQALLIRGQTQQRFATLQALLQQELASDLPVDALFAWMNKNETTLLTTSGWSVEDTQDPLRLRATRLAPPPQVRLTLVLDPTP